MFQLHVRAGEGCVCQVQWTPGRMDIQYSLRKREHLSPLTQTTDVHSPGHFSLRRRQIKYSMTGRVPASRDPLVNLPSFFSSFQSGNVIYHLLR